MFQIDKQNYYIFLTPYVFQYHMFYKQGYINIIRCMFEGKYPYK